MKLKQLVVPLLLAGTTSLTAAVQAESSVTLSGFIDLNFEHITSSGDKTQKNRQTSGGLNNSRFNISGIEDLGSNNKAFFTIEPMFSANDGRQSDQMRQSFMGVRGDWGDFSMGRMFTPSYWVAGYADPNWAAAYSMVNNMEFYYAAYRVDNAFSYKTPSVGGFTGRLFYSGGKSSDTTQHGGRFLSAALEYRNGPLWLGFAHQTQYTQDIFHSDEAHSARDNFFAAVYRIGTVEPTFVFHTYDGYYAYAPWVQFRSSGWDTQLGVRWNIDGPNRVHASFVHRQDRNNKDIGTANGLTIGYIHGLSKRTDLYVNASRVWNKRDIPNPYPVSWIDATPDKGQSPSAIQFGIRHAF